MIMKQFVTTLAVIGLLGAVPTTARADWLFTPFVGANTGGDTVKSRTNFGISAAWIGRGIIGGEFDAGWAPDFFDTGADAKNTLINDTSLSTYMFNVIVGAPVGGQSGIGIRPYGSAGIGAIHWKVGSNLGLVDVSNTKFGWNLGGGAIGFFSDHVGVRGDARFFQAADNALANNAIITDAGRLHFWRVTGAVVFRFGAE
jgi:outer membrane protein with beta-barrel domain